MKYQLKHQSCNECQGHLDSQYKTKLNLIKIKIKWNHWMTVQIDSQPLTDQIMKYIDMCCI